MRVVSLFAGIGGFDLGFERAGAEIVAHVELDAKCRELLTARWPCAVSLTDVREAGAHNLPACDVVTFGFPCQDLSVAGKRAGLAGERSGLYYEATRIVDELRPAYCVWENVPGLLSSDDGRDFARVLLELDRIGSAGAWRVLDAQHFGVAQRRRRLFGLFSRLDSGARRCAEVLSLAEGLRWHPPPCRETGEGVAADVAPCIGASGRGFERAGETRGQDPVVAVAHTLRGDGFDASEDGTGRGTPLVPCTSYALNARGGCGRIDGESETFVPVAFHPTQDPIAGEDVCHSISRGTRQGCATAAVATAMRVRRLTPTECERLQGFPDGWTAAFADSTRYRMLGNAVAVPVAEWIAKRLLARPGCRGEEESDAE